MWKKLMTQIIFDIEANGFNPDKIHCLVYTRGNGDGYTGVTSYEDIKHSLDGASTIIGHNIFRYDIPAIRKITKWSGYPKVVDTLALSWYLYPKRARHNLDSWGKDFGIEKPEVEDWENGSVADYLHRCTEDVKINELLWKKQWRDLRQIYDTDEEAWKLIHYLSFKMQCAADQEEVRWKLDEKTCQNNLEKLSKKYEEHYLALEKAMPPIKIFQVRRRPAKPYKKDGTRSALGEKWFALLNERGLPEHHTDEISIEVGEEKPNPNSNPQVKDWLYSLGWVPRTFKYDRNKETNEFREIPQIRKEVDGSKVLCDSVLELAKKEPGILHLEEVTVLSHRIGILKGFLESVDEEGYVQAQIQGLTNTLRFKHRVVVNLPGVNRAYGKEVRECLIAPEGYELVGSDMSGLEERTKHHYMYPHDPMYVDEMQEADFDPHMDIGLVAGMVTEEQVEARKNGDKSFEGVRHDCKQVNYSCTYGVTPRGIVRNTGMQLKRARVLHKSFWKRNWALKAIANECVTKQALGLEWLYNPVSGFWYELRWEKDKFSTLNQGTGVYCFDSWVYEVKEQGWKICGQFHDEIIIPKKKGVGDKRIKTSLKMAIHKVNEQLKLNRELDVDVQFGGTYADIH